jgi:hypothetical protein
MKKTFVLMATIILTIFMVISVSACRNTTNTISVGNSFDRSKITVQEVKQVKVGDINWNLLKVEDLGTQIADANGNIYPATYGKFIFISFSIENVSTESRTLLDLRVIDNAGRIYNICNQAYGYFTGLSVPTYDACALSQILPDEKPQNFSATFDVDLGSSGLILEFTDLLIPPKDIAYIDLGL